MRSPFLDGVCDDPPLSQERLLFERSNEFNGVSTKKHEIPQQIAG
jgi:hypothetical protein